MPTTTAKLLETLALSHPDVEQGIACAGTAAESRTYKVNNKAFLFVRPKAIMLKLADSLPEAVTLSKKEPKRIKAKPAATSNWVTIQLDAGPAPAKAILQRWVAESYQLFVR